MTEIVLETSKCSCECRWLMPFSFFLYIIVLAIWTRHSWFNFSWCWIIDWHWRGITKEVGSVLVCSSKSSFIRWLFFLFFYTMALHWNMRLGGRCRRQLQLQLAQARRWPRLVLRAKSCIFLHRCLRCVTFLLLMNDSCFLLLGMILEA